MSGTWTDNSPLINILLAAALVYTVAVLAEQWKVAHAREPIVAVQPTHAPPLVWSPEPAPSSGRASTYAGISLHNLFDPSRNPDVVEELPPPPPQIMPRLPLCYGVVNFGDAARRGAILAESSGSAHRFMHEGDVIGQFRLVDTSLDEVVLEWNGTLIHTPLSSARSTVTTESHEQLHYMAPSPLVAVGGRTNTRSEIGKCNAPDGYVYGTQTEGYGKAVPFGCTWGASQLVPSNLLAPVQ